MLIAIIGAFVLFRRGKRELAPIIFGPFIIALGAAAARVYPLNPSRVALYLIPILVIALTAGVEFFARLRPSLAPLTRTILFVLLVSPAPFLLTWSPPPSLVEDVPGVLAHLQANRKPGDRIYVYWASLPATLFYGPKYGINPNDIVMGQMHDKDLAGYQQDLESLHGGSRAWLIFSHDMHPDQRDAILARMNAMGHLVDAYPAQAYRPDASVFLYELTDSTGP